MVRHAYGWQAQHYSTLRKFTRKFKGCSRRSDMTCVQCSRRRVLYINLSMLSHVAADSRPWLSRPRKGDSHSYKKDGKFFAVWLCESMRYISCQHSPMIQSWQQRIVRLAVNYIYFCGAVTQIHLFEVSYGALVIRASRFRRLGTKN